MANSGRARVGVVALWLLAAASFAATDWSTAGRQWWKHVEYLASDQLEGREIGTPGYEKAAQYVASQFKSAGLKPGTPEGFFQPVDFLQTSIDAPASHLWTIRDGRAVEIAVPGEAALGYSKNSAAEFSAPIVFVGYGLKIPEARYDDLAGISVSGAVVAYLTGGPERIDGNLRSHYSSQEERWKALRAAGAVGVIAIPDPKIMEIPWSRAALSWGKPHVALADPAENTTAGLKFSASWNPDKTDDLLAGSGHTFAEILAAAHAQRPLPRFKLACTVRSVVKTTTVSIHSENVVGVLPGADATVRDQYVAISAHLDHLGVGKPVHGDSIYNGAMDDASGVASVIEIARTLHAENAHPRRSILFLAVTGEEKGELGSIYFAKHPMPPGKIIADLNMDMFLPLFPLKWLEVQGLNESTLGQDIRAVAASFGVKVQADKEPSHNRFIRSDQYSFVKTGVPALAFKFGYQPGDPEEKIFKDWYTNRYHGVSDDVNQPVDVAAAAQFNDILLKLALRVADASAVPSWYPNSFFRRFSKAAT